MSLCILVRKPVPIPQARKTPDAKAEADKELEKLKNLPACQESTVESKREVIEQAQSEGRTVHFVTLMNSRHLKQF